MSHSGNWHRNPTKLALERARLAAHTSSAPPGFELDRNEWRVTRTPAGALLRGAVIKGRCHTAECSRRVTVDLSWWVEHGFSEASLFYDVEPSYRCARLRCRFAFDAEAYPRGFPLMLGMKKGEGVRIACAKCNWSTNIDALEFVARIAKAGIGTACSTPEEIASSLRRPCRQCGDVKWSIGRIAGGSNEPSKS